MKKILLFIFCSLIFRTSFSQSNTALGLPSANSSFLGKNGGAGSTDVGVDLYSGAAQINVPICALSSKELKVSVSLNYTAARGIKIQDYATSVGLGWQLNAGGAVTRVVRGFPDELPNGYLGTGLAGKKIEDVNNNVPGATLPAGLNNGLSVPTTDGEPDIYYAQTPFFAFQFTFDGSGNPVVSNDNGIKVLPLSFNSQNSFFKIIDDQGNEYLFTTIEKTTTNLYGTSYTFPTTWYLTNITSFNSKDVINFSYQNAPGNVQYFHYNLHLLFKIMEQCLIMIQYQINIL